MRRQSAGEKFRDASRTVFGSRRAKYWPFEEVLYCGATGRRHLISCRPNSRANVRIKRRSFNRQIDSAAEPIVKERGYRQWSEGCTEMGEGWSAATIKSCERWRRWSVFAMCSCDDLQSARGPTCSESRRSSADTIIVIQRRSIISLR